MSFDLLNEFGNPQESPWSHVTGQSVASGENSDEEDFGDFESPESSKPNIGTQFGPISRLENQLFLPSVEGTVSKQDAGASRQPQFASFQEAEKPSNDNNEWGEVNGTAILFDAERFKDDISSHTRQNNLHQPQSDESLTERPMKVSLLPIASREVITRRVKPVHVKPTELYDFDQAENWEPILVGQEPMLPGGTLTLGGSSTIPKSEANSVSMVETTDMGTPPSNVPPPSVLLSLIVNLLQSLLDDVRNNVTPYYTFSNLHEAFDQWRIDHLRAALSTVSVAARIVAGRKLRWKRDSLLSQSMKIGPAGKSTGMKLTGVDKAESRREDQEAAEALNVWRRHVGPVRSTVSKVNAHLPGTDLAIPEISEHMPIRVVKSSEGAVSAPKCCFLCGIKRDERVAKVDVNVEDSFGEYWTEHWGHVECVAFWNVHQHSLPHR